MKMRDKIKKLKWLLEHKNDIEKLIDKMNKEEVKSKKEKNYSLAGVPDYQLSYINDILEAKK